MDLTYIENKLREIKEIKARILEELNRYDESKSSIASNKFKRRFKIIKDLKIACIMDEFTYNSFEPECELLQLTPQNWKNELEKFQPDLFFIESAWRGKDGLWNTKVAHLSDELIQVIHYCKINNIPVVFWNKEDPVHFDTFLATAKYADFVFTTDIDCIKKYKSLLNHDRVYLMPFAAQTKIHNPIELYERQNKFCFAGAYYKRYPDRARDLETFVDTISEVKGLDIYDRNFHNKDPNYSFPRKYKKYIVGNLRPEEIDKAYKGYRFNINMNSVKQSQSMCARRIFELLASNTVTFSNYSRAIRNFLGDLVITTDDSKRLKDEILKFEDEEYYNKFRLLGLRKVLLEHTYKHRVQYMVKKIFDENLEATTLRLAVISKPTNDHEFEWAINQFERQSYKNKKLYIIYSIKSQVNEKLIPSNVEIISRLDENYLNHINNNFDLVAFFSNNDYYAKNYLLDLVLGFQYSDKQATTKTTYFIKDNGQIKKNMIHPVYSLVNKTRLRCSIIRTNVLDNAEIINAANNIDDAMITITGISIDEYNYCMNSKQEVIEVVHDLELIDTGMQLDEIYRAAENIRGNSDYERLVIISGKEIGSQISIRPNIEIQKTSDQKLYVKSALTDNHEYLYLNHIYALDEFTTNQDKLDLYLNIDFIKKFSVDLAVILLDAKKNKINSIVRPCNRKITVEIDHRVKFIKLGIRFSGSGNCIIKELLIGRINTDAGVYLNKSRVLMVADNYPAYNDLYRYAFIHTRLKEYKNNGLMVDVFRFNERYAKGFSEFYGIDITTGSYEELNNAVSYGNYDTVLVHFLSERLWNAIKHHLHGKKVVVWIHGAEIQPWWRRKFNYTTDKELEIAKEQSKKREEFWKSIFDLAIKKEYNFHFVFVSQYFANEVFEDMKIELPNELYSVIHNYINTNLFKYNKKDEELRKKILAIRPFTSHKYANDLMVKAILELTKYPHFNDLEFRIVGKGELFHTITKPIKKYRNVILEEKFLRQEEIAELHKSYGVFLSPTRWDSQGVSRDEAMSSGLVPITNNVSAIPEFVDEKCGMLVGAEDYKAIAASIIKIYENPELFLKLSESAAQRVKNQSSYENTIKREIALIMKG